eukprot:5462391-Prymnesium_polylepis.1
MFARYLKEDIFNQHAYTVSRVADGESDVRDEEYNEIEAVRLALDSILENVDYDTSTQQDLTKELKVKAWNTWEKKKLINQHALSLKEPIDYTKMKEIIQYIEERDVLSKLARAQGG